MAINYIKLIANNHPEIKVSCIGDTSDFNNIVFLSGSITQTELDGEYLDSYKKEKNITIDSRTRELIEQGFIYNSTLFSTSETAQRNWMAIDQFRNDLTYPFAISTANDGEYQLQDATEVHNFVLTGLGTVEYYYASGRALKLQVNAATSVSEVDAVQDNR